MTLWNFNAYSLNVAHGVCPIYRPENSLLDAGATRTWPAAAGLHAVGTAPHTIPPERWWTAGGSRTRLLQWLCSNAVWTGLMRRLLSGISSWQPECRCWWAVNLTSSGKRFASSSCSSLNFLHLFVMLKREAVHVKHHHLVFERINLHSSTVFNWFLTIEMDRYFH